MLRYRLFYRLILPRLYQDVAMAGTRLVSQRVIFLVIYMSVNPLEGENQFAGQSQIFTLEFFQVMLILGQLAANAQCLQRNCLRDRLNLGKQRRYESFVVNESLSIFCLLAGSTDSNHNVLLTLRIDLMKLIFVNLEQLVLLRHEHVDNFFCLGQVADCLGRLDHDHARLCPQDDVC